jgi:hypothetical protein
MKKMPSIILILAMQRVFGQGSIILNNGQEVNFTKFKEFDTYLLVSAGKEKIKLDAQKIKGYFNDFESLFFYRMPNTNPKLLLINPNTYQFMVRVVNGKINLYKKEEISQRTSAVSSTYNVYYIEKNDECEFIYQTQGNLLSGRNEKMQILKSFMSDNAYISQLLDSEFKLTEENLIKIIKEYNLLEFKPTNPTIIDSAKVKLYRLGVDLTHNLEDRVKYGKLSKEPIQIFINQKNYMLDNYHWMEITVPAEELIKVCFGEVDKNCELLYAHRYFTNYLELALDKKSNLYSVDVKSETEAQSMIEDLNDYNKRNSKKPK